MAFVAFSGKTRQLIKQAYQFQIFVGLLVFLFIYEYIFFVMRSKKPKTVSNKLDSFFTSSPEKQLSAFGKIENPVFNGTSEFHRTSSSSSPVYTATVKSKLNQNITTDGLLRNKVRSYY